MTNRSSIALNLSTVNQNMEFNIHLRIDSLG